MTGDQTSGDWTVNGGRMPPPSRFGESVRQSVLDAGAILQVSRSAIARRLAEGTSASADIVAVGGPAIDEWRHREGQRWQELLSVQPATTAAQLRVSLPDNRRFVERGARMVSLYDYEGLDDTGRILLANETLGTYLVGVGPIRVDIVDRQFVLLQGPDVDGAPSAMKVTSRSCLAAAWRYWQAALALAAPPDTTGNLDGLTARQQQITGLLAADLGDEAIAAALDVSIRTVRADIAVVMARLGVTSRFAAGNRLRIWADERPT